MECAGVIPAKAGIQRRKMHMSDWMPAFSGMTEGRLIRPPANRTGTVPLPDPYMRQASNARAFSRRIPYNSQSRSARHFP
jgi:hypothetical protein